MDNIADYLKNYKKSKDTKWFEGMYNIMMPKIYRFYYLKTFNRELSEDLTSEVFIRVYSNIDKTDLNERSFMAWIYKIANNLLIDHFRKNKDKGLQVELEDDSVITLEEVQEVVNTDLSKGISGQIARVSKMIDNFFDGKIPETGLATAADIELIRYCKETVKLYRENFASLRISKALDTLRKYLTEYLPLFSLSPAALPHT